MVGTIAFDGTAITAVGGSAGAPIGFIDLWNSDIAGSRILKTATTSPFTASLTTAVKPADSKALRLRCVITNFSVAGTVAFTGTDAWGNALSEAVNITANGTFTTGGYFGAINANGVVAVGTFTVAITQPRWGVVWKQSTTEYVLDCLLYVGDNTNATYFTDSNKLITVNVNGYGGGTYVIACRTNATLTFGMLVSATLKTTKLGCTFVVLNNSAGYIRLIYTVGGSIYLYGCTVQGTNTQETQIYANTIWNTTFSLTNVLLIPPAVTDYFGMNFLGCAGLNSRLNDSLNITNMNVLSSNRVCQIYINTVDASITNLYARGNAIIASILYPTSGSFSFIDPDVDTWAFIWSTEGLTIYRKYTFNLTTDPGATVTLKDNAGNTVFSVTSDAVTGAIATQTVSRGYYNSPNGNTLQDYGPFTLTVTKTGKMPYTQTGIVLAEKTKWQITLRDQLTGNAAVDDVVSGKKFYKDDVDTQLVGSLALTGTAIVADVAKDKTFYGTDPKTKLTGAHLNPAVFVDVLSGKPVINLKRADPNNKTVISV